MAGENIVISVTDGVATTVQTKLRNIATEARNADGAITSLQNAINGLGATDGLTKLQNQLQKTASVQKQLTAQQQQSAKQYLATETALNRAILAETKAATAAAQLEAAQAKAALQAAKLDSAQNAASVSGEKLAQAQAQTATAQAHAAAAATQAQTATANLAAAQARANTATVQTATATTRAATATTQGATAAARLTTEQQRLATETQRTAAQTANAAAAQDRAALSALRLQQAQERANAAQKEAGTVLSGYITAAAGAVGLGLGADAILKEVDAYTALQNKLQNVTTSQEQVNKLTGELFDLANQTRTSVEATATAFTRFDRSLAFLGKSQEDTLRLTKTINEALIVSGATSEEASSALIQLSQGFNAGKLQGDEFRSVAESMPLVLDAVAKALNVPINQVKNLSSQGKITSEVLFKAFALIQDSIDKTFAKTTPTVSQSLVLLKNSTTQFFGELNKATGTTTLLSKAIIVLANNLNVVAGAVAVVGAAFVVYFAGTITAAIGTATSAMLAFTVAVMSNPVGLIAVAITAAAAAITIFGDQIKVSSDGLTSLKDVALAVWSYIADGAKTAWQTIESLWDSASSSITQKTTGLGDVFKKVFGGLYTVATTPINLIIGAFVAAYNAIAVTWQNFPAMMTALFDSVVNAGAKAVELLANGWQVGLRGIASIASGIAPDLAKSLQAKLDATKIQLPRVDVSKDAAAAAAAYKKAVSDAFGKDYIGDAHKAILSRAQQIGQNRAAAAANTASTQLRGTGKNQMGADVDSAAAKAAERRATALAKINMQLDDESARMFKLQPQREAQQKLDQIEEQLAGKKITLNQQERDSIMAKIKANQDAAVVQQKFDSIYNDSVGPLRDYNATVTAGNKLLAMGAISHSDYEKAVTKAKEAYLNASDPMRQYNKDLQQQIDLLQMLPRQRQIEQQVMQVTNDQLAKGHVLSQTELDDLRQKLKLQQQLNDVSTQEATLLSNSVDKRRQFADQLTAINKLLADQKSGFTKNDALSALGNDSSGVGQYLTNSPEMVNAQVAQYQTMYDQIDALRQKDIISEQTASAAKLQVWSAEQKTKLSTADTFFGDLAVLSSSHNKKIAAIGKAASIAQTMIKTYESATSAYSSLASIPYVGPALGAAAAAAAVAAGLVNVQKIRATNVSGYMKGGYTGGMSTTEERGVVHGKEFVMTAATTSRVGVSDLQALQSGAASVQRNGENVGTGQSSAPAQAAPVTVNTPITAVVVQSQEAALAAMKSAEGQAFIIKTLENNRGTVAQIIGTK